jgi:hypothetical protein
MKKILKKMKDKPAALNSMFSMWNKKGGLLSENLFDFSKKMN